AERIAALLELARWKRGAVEREDGDFADLHACNRACRRSLIAVRRAGSCQYALGYVARAGEERLADRIELKVTIVRVGDDRDRIRLARLLDRGIGEMRQRAEQRKVRDGREQAPAEDDFLAPDAIRQPAEHDEERRREHQRACDEQVGSLRLDLQRLREKE